jgi:hypothetical protein
VIETRIEREDFFPFFVEKMFRKGFVVGKSISAAIEKEEQEGAFRSKWKRQNRA